MSTLTGILYAALAAYVVSWYLGALQGDFALLLFLLTLVSFAYWLAERFYFRPHRLQAAAAVERAFAERRTLLAKDGKDAAALAKVDTDLAEARGKVLAQPWWLDWTAGLFPVILAVFLLRSFIAEPFKIPSGSMMPTLEVGDLILVNKYDYGIRLPVIDRKVVAIGDPKRGDVIVFRVPTDENVDYIKRVVGLPGDEVAYLNKRLTINGKPVEEAPLPDYYDPETLRYVRQFREQLGDMSHRILNNPDAPAAIDANGNFPFGENCRYTVEGVTCRVPAGHYFVMGDNRDNSLDSRYWGFVPDRNIVGRAFFVWMNFGDFKRIGALH